MKSQLNIYSLEIVVFIILLLMTWNLKVIFNHFFPKGFYAHF